MLDWFIENYTIYEWKEKNETSKSTVYQNSLLLEPNSLVVSEFVLMLVKIL